MLPNVSEEDSASIFRVDAADVGSTSVLNIATLFSAVSRFTTLTELAVYLIRYTEQFPEHLKQLLSVTSKELSPVSHKALTVCHIYRTLSCFT
jgi:hypothetical protein